MRALTLIRPMAAAIVHGTKRIENRPMDLPRAMRGVRTVVAVHAGKKWDDEYWETVHRLDTTGISSAGVPYAARCRDEGIVGLMALSGRVFTVANRALLEGVRAAWFSGPYGYEIEHAIALPSPIPCRGMQGFWPLPREIEEDVTFRIALGALTSMRGTDGVDPRG